MNSSFVTDVFSLLIDNIKTVEGELTVVESKSHFLATVLANDNPSLSASWKTFYNEFSLYKQNVLDCKKTLCKLSTVLVDDLIGNENAVSRHVRTINDESEHLKDDLVDLIQSN